MENKSSQENSAIKLGHTRNLSTFHKGSNISTTMVPKKHPSRNLANLQCNKTTDTSVVPG